MITASIYQTEQSAQITVHPLAHLPPTFFCPTHHFYPYYVSPPFQTFLTQKMHSNNMGHYTVKHRVIQWLKCVM